MRVVFFIFFMMTSWVVFSQENNKITLCGLVLDTNNQPISNANIFDSLSLKGTTTNIDGFFYLSIKKQLITLQLSHISYYHKTITLYKTSFDKTINDTLRITIKLQPKINLLAPFEITSHKIALIYHKPFVTILDYQFYGDDILLLLKEDNDKKLKLMNINQKVLKELIVPKKTNQLYKDCFGNIHVLSKDTAYQIHIDSLGISLLYRCSIILFNTQLKPCLTKFNNNFVFNQFGKYNQSVSYFYLDRNKRKTYLKTIINGAAARTASQEAATIRQLKSTGSSLTGESKSSLYIAREIFDRTSMYEKIFTKFFYSPLFVLEDSLYIFDHVNDSCFIYNEKLNLKRSFFISYHHSNNWAKKIIEDNTNNVVYAVYEKDGFSYLEKIDLYNGKIVAEYKIEQHIFPTKIKIKGNIVYYLYQDYFNHGQMSLYKQGLY